LTSAPEGREGSASRPGGTLPPRKARYPLYRKLGGPQGRCGQVRKISPPTEFTGYVAFGIYIITFSVIWFWWFKIWNQINNLQLLISVGVGEIRVVLLLRSKSIKCYFVNAMHVNGTFCFYYVGTKRLLSTRRGWLFFVNWWRSDKFLKMTSRTKEIWQLISSLFLFLHKCNMFSIVLSWELFL
jgi:hypothetical protein